MADMNELQLPRRWADLDPETIEWIARLNEGERRRLIDLSHMKEKEAGRLRQLLALEDDKWEAGFRMIKKAAGFNNLTKAFPRFVLGLAALLVALDQIWTRVVPWIIGGR